MKISVKSIQVAGTHVVQFFVRFCEALLLNHVRLAQFLVLGSGLVVAGLVVGISLYGRPTIPVGGLPSPIEELDKKAVTSLNVKLRDMEAEHARDLQFSHAALFKPTPEATVLPGL